MDKVSVIMPVFNSMDTLETALESIVAQSYRPIEIVIIDDHSNDGSYAFAKAYSIKHTTPQLTFICSQNSANSGAGISRNKALDLTTGRYIAFLDSDDLWKPHKLTLQIEAMTATNAQVCYSAYEIFKTTQLRPVAVQNVFKILTFDKLMKANYLGNLTGIYDTKHIGKIPIPDLRKRQDWAMWLDVLKKAHYAIGIQEPLANYRQGKGISSNKWDLISYNYAVYRTHLNYSHIKSAIYMLRFFYEQFAVKGRLKVKI